MLVLDAFSDLSAGGFDTIIDVRSPAEYAEDHVPGAINLPVLNNEERAEVGTLYKQISPFIARKRGAALVFANAARHIEQHLSGHDGGWRPLVYCWRGGQRSGSFAWMLKEIGWRSDTIQGGYKSYRRLVVRCLYDDPLTHKLVLLSGYTGAAKTALLPLLADRGVQVLDLEGLARHRGSLLGGMGRPQPSQKAFESALAARLGALDPARPVLVEAESSKIGQRILPPSLWGAMCNAPVLVLEAPLDARASYLASAYSDILADKAILLEKLNVLRRHRGHAVVDHWADLSAAGDDVALCRALVQDHYDPAYRASFSALAHRVVARVQAEKLTGPALEQAADRVKQALQTIKM